MNIRVNAKIMLLSTIIALSLSTSKDLFAITPYFTQTDLVAVPGMFTLGYPDANYRVFQGDTIYVPTNPIWMRNIYTQANQRVVLLWDASDCILHSWYLSWNGSTWKFEGGHRLWPGFPDVPLDSTFTIPSPLLEAPLLSALNRPASPDSILNEFRCLDRSVPALRTFEVDFSTREVTETGVDTLSSTGGTPIHSVYIQGEKGTHEGITWFREEAQAWEWYPLGDRRELPPPYMSENHTELYSYAIGATVPVWAQDKGFWFTLYQPMSGSIHTFSVGYDFDGQSSVIEGHAPIRVGYYPMLENWFVTRTVHPVKLIGSFPMDSPYPVAIDKQGHLWAGTGKPQVLLYFEDGVAPARRIGEPAEHEGVKITTSFQDDRSIAVYLDFSLTGYLTVVWNGGVETYQVHY